MAEKYLKLIKIVEWLPVIDLWCDLIGSNALAALYHTAKTNCLKNQEFIAGKAVWSNPAFHMCRQCI